MVLASELDFTTLRFLIADDQAFIRGLVHGMLTRLGARNLAVAANGVEALEEIRRRGNSIDCIISDWNMQPIGGLELLRMVRMGSLAEIPRTTSFIMLSGFATSMVVELAAQLDVSAYLIKPVSSEKLAVAVKKTVHRRWDVKPAEFYRDVEVIETPNDGEPIKKSATAWATWVKQGQPVICELQSEHIRRELIRLGHAPTDDAEQIKKIRRREVARIKPGTVLVEDFCDDQGVVLITAGTVLNEEILRSLAAIQSETSEEIQLWIGKR